MNRQQTEEARQAFTISQYNTAVASYLKGGIPRSWVHGTVTSLAVRERATFLSIGDFAEGETNARATLDLVIWTSNFRALQEKLSRLPSPFELKPQLKVCLLLEADFYVPQGRFRPRILDIDENFTLGELLQTRQRILERLRKDGLLEKNKALPFPEAPLRVGLITSPGSAAYQDFTSTLLQSGFGFQILLHPAVMQGEETEPSVVRALAKLGGLAPYVICIVRGGGARTDLTYFDSENICRAIANCPVPVLTGIGHEIDHSLADVVAWADRITPTDCAKHLQAALQTVWTRVQNSARQVTERWHAARENAGEEVAERARLLAERWQRRRELEEERMAVAVRDLRAASVRGQASERERLGRNVTGLARGSRKILGLAAERQTGAARLLLSLWRKGRTAAGEALGLKGNLLRSLDPASLMRRGLAVLRGADGKIMRSVGRTAPGDLISVELLDGVIRAQVTSKEAKP